MDQSLADIRDAIRKTSMQKDYSEWANQSQSGKLYSAPSSYQTISPLSAVQRELIGQPANLLFVESAHISPKLCQEACLQEHMHYTIVPDLATAHILIHDGESSSAPFDLFISELSISDQATLHLLMNLCKQDSGPAVIAVGAGSADEILTALRLRVADYLPLPIRSEHVRIAVESVLAQRQATIRQAQLFHCISNELEQLYHLIQLRKDAHEAQFSTKQLVIGPLSINTERHSVEWYGQAYAVTPTEYALLRYLAETPGQPRRYSDIVRWTHDQILSEQEAKLLLKSHVRNLRRKFGQQLLEHVKGTGYILHDLSPNGTLG
jgi:DNA-binding response OmpR family regulator